FAALLEPYKIKSKKILLLNKTDLIKDEIELEQKKKTFESVVAPAATLTISALKHINTDKILNLLLEHLPVAPPFFPDDDISDRPVRFFVSELIREKIYILYEQ